MAVEAHDATNAVKALGIDPGLAETGYAVIGTRSNGGRAYTWGSIKTSSSAPLPQRLKLINTSIAELICRWQPVLLVMEDVYVLNKYPKAAIQLGEVRGVIYLAAENSALDIMKIRPTEVKSCLTGNGRATKDHVNRSVKRILNIRDDIKPDHASDAAALAIIGLSRKGLYQW